MGRKSGIWLRKQNKTWYVNHRGRQINLGKNKAAAEKQFHRLMAEEEVRETRSITAAELFDKFLLWCRDNRAERTFEWYRDHLQNLLDHLPDKTLLPVISSHITSTRYANLHGPPVTSEDS
jgi:hypothetical protein